MLIGWCSNCNVPVLNAKTCGICSLKSSPMSVRRGDLKPVFPPEKKFYNEIIDKSLGINKDLLPPGLCFSSRGSIIIDGQKPFRILFSRKNFEWEVKINKNCELKELRGSNLKKVIKANEKILKEKEKEAINFLENTFKKYDKPAVVSASGGKDSSCTLFLARKVKKNIPVIFMNTTLAFPETIEYINKLRKEWKLNLVEIFPERTFLDLAKELGPPSRLLHWCCYTQKFGPFNRYLNENYPDGVLSVEGLRRFESEKRMNYERISVNRAIPKKIAICPILDWTTLDVWLYTIWKKIPINPSYKHGFDRIGCWACPYKKMSEIMLIKKMHPELIDQWYSFLLDYASKNGKDESWVYDGKWRIRCEGYEKIPRYSRSICSVDTSCSRLFEIKDSSIMKRVKEFMKIFGEVREVDGFLMIREKDINISITKTLVKVSSKEKSILKKFEKQLSKAINCVGCGACVGVCEALKVEDNELKIDENLCKHCLRCTTSKYLRMSCIALNYKKKRYVWKDTMVG